MLTQRPQSSSSGEPSADSKKSGLDDIYDGSEPPKNFRLLSDIYNETEEVEIADELLMLAGVDEPANFKQASKEGVWKEVMECEIEAIERNNTWELTNLPEGHKAIDLKWVYKVKRDTNGGIIEHKARLVVKRYVQKHGIYYEEVFAPVTRLETLNKCLEKLEFVKCPFEHAVYTKREGEESLLIGVYVDDLIITGTSVSNIAKFKLQMSKEFEMSDLGKLSYYLGIEVEQGNGFIELKQMAYAKKVLDNAEEIFVEETVGSLKVHEERLRGQSDNNGGQELLLTEEEWMKRENSDGQLLLTREEWLTRTSKDGTRSGREVVRGVRDRSKVRCFNCSAYEHFAAECRKPKREKKAKNEVNLAQINGDEPTLLLAKCKDVREGLVLLNEKSVTPRLNNTVNDSNVDSNIWYLDNGASNHMTEQRGKFKELDKGVNGQVKFGDGSTVKIQGRGSVQFTTSDGKECILRERHNKTVVAMDRSLLNERDMPSHMWGEAIRHAVYLLNRLPTHSLSGTTPYEAWSGEKPQVDYLKVFGCIAYMKVPGTYLKKLDNRSKCVVHLGREAGTKAYRLLDPDTGTIHINRDAFLDATIASTVNSSVPGHVNAEIAEFKFRRTKRRQQKSGLDDTYDGSEPPKNFRLLGDIYNETEEMEIADELLMLAGVDEPANFKQANKEGVWKVAMECEIEAIERNNTWELTNLPEGHKAIDLKWVYKVKRDTNGGIIKHKARLVAKRLETVRLLLALAAKSEWEVHHLDVKSAFMNGKLYEEVYVNQPEGFVKEGQEEKVYKLFKALYGLRQAPRAWYTQLNKCLEKLGFVKCPFEHAVYTKREGEESLLIGVYVDDLIITGTSVSNIAKFKLQMSKVFEMSDLGKLSYYLSIEVEQGNGFIELKQMTYAKKVLDNAGMSDCNAVKFPMEPKI
ncbi:uncharacterized protein LOC141691029 [Apium graveolens]|uniref:uncharacterized protein LOC141691029 n=1 Tax=Apium graveolens TaxID=4045 RepID=UPI003D7C0E75